MNCDTNPLEAGLDYFIKLNKVTIHLSSSVVHFSLHALTVYIQFYMIYFLFN